ncbi:hypothetical protein FIV42_16170 [Persicimonas caeni]|uniref:Uncharacterized protein n=1 Tax=Persicimonas caeni TaxID=2292766 RepID=A0A4Y6PV82_PERCE|nr:hypothetical protein [Persicimonas caeni]QDG52218.1 hypothetical protein FIV42_16170 [Persicimonas caeni]QED33440.1 hypothetical protein FRD00_16165 [Persicimonas caeni]
MEDDISKHGLGLELTGFSEATMSELPEPTGEGGFDSPEELFGILDELLQKAADVENDVNRCLASPEDVAADDLKDRTVSLLDESLTLVERLANHTTHPLGEELDFVDARFAVSMVFDELDRQRGVVAQTSVDELELQRALTIIAQAKGVMTKALINLERALCEGSAYQPRLGDYLSLEDSLETRRVYGKMRRALLEFERPQETPPHDEVVARLRRAGTSFIQLRGHSSYPALRVEDRFQFDRLWDRVYGWLQSESQDEETYSGWLIWEDVINFVELLSSINFRQELREHDVLLANDALARMESLDSDALVGEALADDLAALTGYNTVIDELIAQGAKATVKDWRRPLLHIQRGS